MVWRMLSGVYSSSKYAIAASGVRQLSKYPRTSIAVGLAVTVVRVAKL